MIKIKEIQRRCVILGFGGVAKPVCYILTTRYPMKEYLLVDKRKIDEKELQIFKNQKVTTLQIDIKPEILYDTIFNIIKDGDIVCDFFGCSETIDILRGCNLKKDIFYVNSSLEENTLKPYPSQKALYDAFDEFKNKYNTSINGCIDAGANPGLITHFAILGLFSMGEYAIKNNSPDSKEIEILLKSKQIAKLAELLKIDVIHISEIEEIEPNDPSKLTGYVTNSWCINSFLDEWNTNAEITVGSHDKQYFTKNEYKLIPLSYPPSVKCPFPFYLKSASPTKMFTGKVVSHPETLEISNLFSTEKHIPTVAFVYHPSRLTRQTLENKNWKNLPHKIFEESNSGLLIGSETMGAILISSRDDIPPRWFGSIVTCEQERAIGSNSNPTVLQVAAGIISHLIASLDNPGKGLCMPHDFDSKTILEIAEPFLGSIVDINLPFRLPTSWEDLISTKEKMDYDLI